MRMLIAEDDPGNMDALKLMLSSQGHCVTACSDGLEALAAFEADPTGFEVLLLDLVMPHLDGLTLARRIRERPDGAAPAIVLLTAQAHPHPAALAHEAGCDATLLKPYRYHELRALLSELALVSTLRP